MTIPMVLLKVNTRLQTSQSARRWLFYAGETLAAGLSILALFKNCHALYWLCALPLAVASVTPVIMSLRAIHESTARVEEGGI